MKTIGIFVVLSWVLRLVMISVIIFIGFGALAFFTNQNSVAPEVDKAAYGIQTYSEDGMGTPSRIYFTDNIRYLEKGALLTGYWKYDGKKYKYIDDDKILTEPFTLVRRRK